MCLPRSGEDSAFERLAINKETDILLRLREERRGKQRCHAWGTSAATSREAFPIHSENEMIYRPSLINFRALLMKSHLTSSLCICLLILASSSGRAQKPELVVQTGHFGHVMCAAYSPDGRVLASGSTDGKIKFWDVYTGREFRTINVNAPVEALAFRPDGKTLHSASDDGTLTVWEVDSARELKKVRREPQQASKQNEVHLAALSADGRLGAETTLMGQEITLWDLNTGKVLRTLSADTTDEMSLSGDFTQLTLSADGNLLAGATVSAGIKIWDVASGRLLLTIKRGESAAADPLSFSPDSRTLAASGADRLVRLYDVATGRKGRALGQPLGEVSALVFAPDSKTLASVHLIKNEAEATESRTIKLWDVPSGQKLRGINARYNDEVQAAIFSPDSKVIATAGGDIIKGELTLWDVATGVGIRVLTGQTNRVNALAFGAGDTLLASYGYGAQTKIWQMGNGREQHSFPASSFALSADGKRLAGLKSFEGLKLWDAANGAELQSIPLKSSGSGNDRPLAFSPDGKLLACGGQIESFGQLSGELKLWDAATGKELRTLADKASAIAFSADGKMLAGGVYNSSQADAAKSPYTTRLWDTASWKEIQLPAQTFPDAVRALAFSPDSRILAIATADKGNDYIYGKIVLQDVQSGKELHTLGGYTGNVEAIAFSPDGQTLIGGDLVGNIKRWDVATGKEIAVFNEHSASITSLVFSRDGSLWASASRDGQIIMRDNVSNAEIIRWIIIGENDYLIVTPDGYYFSTRAGAPDALSFRFAGRAFPFEQFDLKFNRPDLALQKLGKATPDLIATYYKAYQKRLQLAGFTEASLISDFQLPLVSITTPNLPVSTKQRTLAFKVKASDAQYQLARLNVYVNETPLYGAGGEELRAQKTRAVERDISLELSDGLNKVQVSVINERGVEGTITFRVNYDGPARQPQLYVLAVGVSQYKDTRYNLTYAAKDATDLVSLLEQRAGQREQAMVIDGQHPARMQDKAKSFYQVHALKLLDADATRENILKARDFLRQAKPDDEVIVFFAGHGLLDQKLDYYFGTTDINFSNPAERGLSYEELESLLDAVPSRRKLLLVDTCHAGEVDKDEAQTSAASETKPQDKAAVKLRAFPRSDVIGAARRTGLTNSYALLQELFADLRRGSGAAVISAASGLEFAYEDGSWNNGVFTYSVLNGLKAGLADDNHNGEVSVSELRDYVTASVRKLTGGKQTPTARREKLENDFRMF